MYKVVPYEIKYYNRWNNFINQSLNRTIFQSLDFLDHHGEKYKKDENHFLILKGEEIFRVLPVVKLKNTIVSPYGSSFGGVVVSKKCSLSNAISTADALKEYLNKLLVNSVEMFISPNHYFVEQNPNITFAFKRIGFIRVSSEIFNFIELPKKEEEFRGKNTNQNEIETGLLKYLVT